MAKNGEDLFAQEKFERERGHYRRLTTEQKEITLLKRQLKHCQESNQHLEEKHYQIDRAINLYDTGKRSEGITLDTIRGIMR